MHFDTVNVTFAWDLEINGSYERVDEQRLREQWETYRGAVLDRENVTGALTISGDGGEALVQDELWHTMSRLCFSIPPLLSNGVAATFNYLTWDGGIRLSVEGSLVLVTGGDVPSFTVPVKELVRGPVQCGQRYRELIGRVKDDPSTYSGLWDMLSGLAPEANEALTCEPDVTTNTRPDLMRVRIPSHWWFMKNDFIDADPVVGEAGRLLPAGYFIEDILSMELRRPSAEGGTAPAEYVVDLGWYPDQDPSGHYRLTLLGTSWEDILASFESRDRFLVRDVLERWLSQVDRARDRAQLERWLKKDA